MRLILLGDVMLGRLVNRALKTEPPEYPWGDTLLWLRSADAVVLNLECVVSDRGEPWPGKLFTFRSDAKNVETLAQAEVAAVALANNHALDMGGAALEDCVSLLAARGIASAGAGASLEQARRPAFFTFGTARAALVAFTDNRPDWEAKGTTPGLFYAPVDPADGRFQVLLEIVREAAREADLVVVSAHWGGNWGEDPPGEHVRAAQLLVEAGAGVVWGHSAHVFRGLEIRSGKPVLYGCGDFIDDYAVDTLERNDQSFVFALDFDGGGLRRLFLVPTVIRNLQARLAQGHDRDQILTAMRARCARLGTRLRPVEQGLEVDLGPAAPRQLRPR